MQRTNRRHPDKSAAGRSAYGPRTGQPAQAAILPAWNWVPALLLVLVTVLAYLPALSGGFVWDDDSWTTNLLPLFQNISGLRAIWFHPTILQQYYPLSGTTFWLDYQLWSFRTTPYHVENVLLHALAVLLFWRLLLRLRVPGAGLAAAIFALHPVMVESVAWITERKNVLSLVFYLGAWLAYLRYAQGGQWSVVSSQWSVAETKTVASIPDASPATRHASLFYDLAFILFLGALLAKTTTFSLPAAILLIGWWQRGQIRWWADVLPTLPFFVLAIGLCLVTSWLEKNHVGAEGPDFALTFSQRCLVAGHAFWFYLGKLFWPANLCFVYPRWQPDPGLWWQWVPPLTAIGALIALWLARKRIGRGPVTALLFYVGTLFPVLGFLNAYGMRYSFVWDHWVYLSAPGIIALVAAGVVRAAEALRRPAVVYGFAAIALPALTLLTWRQAGMYTDKETLWWKTIERNPDCWMAYNNLANHLSGKERKDEAIACFQKAVAIKPDFAEACNNLGVVYMQVGQVQQAIGQYLQALKIQPGYVEARFNLGAAYAQVGQAQAALDEFNQTLKLQPGYAPAYYGLGIVYLQAGQVEEAIRLCQQSLKLQPACAEAHNTLGTAYLSAGRGDDAAQEYRLALAVQPGFAPAHYNLGNVLLRQGQVKVAIDEYLLALKIQPNYADALNSLGVAYVQAGSVEEAIVAYHKALALQRENVDTMNNLAWALSLGPPDVRRGAEAVELAQQASRLAGGSNPQMLRTLAAAYAKAGRYSEAAETARRARQLALTQGVPELAEVLKQEIGRYEAGPPTGEAK